MAKGMAERRRICPLLVYGALVAIAAARRKETGRAHQRTRASESDETVSKPRRILYRVANESTEFPGESRVGTHFDPDKRPKEQFENDQPILAQLHRAKERGRGRRATAPWRIPWTGWKDILWRVLCERE
jgi:hypothetical protein